MGRAGGIRAARMAGAEMRDILIGCIIGLLIGTLFAVKAVEYEVHAIYTECHWVKQ
jgi:hypothetical protein